MAASQAMRALRAGCFVAALVAFAPASGVVAGFVREAQIANATIQVMTSDASAEGLVDVLRKGEQGGVRSLPEGFQEELFSLDWADDVRASDDGAVVCFFAKGNMDDVFMQVKEDFMHAGWDCSENATPYGCSFTKASGRYRWVFVSCCDIHGRVGVLLQGLNQGASK